MTAERDAAAHVAGYLRRATGIRLDAEADVLPRMPDLYLFCLDHGMAPVPDYHPAAIARSPDGP